MAVHRGVRACLLSPAEQSLPEHAAGIIDHCSLLLRKRKATSKGAKLAAMRRHTHALWEASCEEATRRHLSLQYPHWRPFMCAWRSMGDILQLPPEETSSARPWDAWHRCHWRECLCSVHRLVHPRRRCGGCSDVVYCGERCQRSDWNDGGHRDRCRRNKRVSAG